MSLSIRGERRKKAPPQVMGEMNTTPLIDVMLVLLVMLIITIPIQLHTLDLNLPSGRPPPAAAEPEVVRIDIGSDGSVLWNGEPVPDRAALEVRMRHKALQAEQPELHLRANRQARYDAVALVMASAQRLGLKKLGLVGNEQFAQ